MDCPVPPDYPVDEGRRQVMATPTTPPQDELSYRADMVVRQQLRLPNGDLFSLCPRCGGFLEREYMRFCDHCGQKLNWQFLSHCTIIR